MARDDLEQFKTIKMKKLLLFFALVFSLSGYAQLDSLNPEWFAIKDIISLFNGA